MHPQTMAVHCDWSDNAAGAAKLVTEEFCATLMSGPRACEALVRSSPFFP